MAEGQLSWNPAAATPVEVRHALEGAGRPFIFPAQRRRTAMDRGLQARNDSQPGRLDARTCDISRRTCASRRRRCWSPRPWHLWRSRRRSTGRILGTGHRFSGRRLPAMGGSRSARSRCRNPRRASALWRGAGPRATEPWSRCCRLFVLAWEANWETAGNG